MRPVARALRVLPIVGLLMAVLAAPVAGFELNGGCALDLTSTDASGATLDTASGGPGGGSGGTQADPFLVDWDGNVSWVVGSGDQVFMDHSWQVFVFNIPTPVRGGDPNDAGNTSADGSAGVGENAPFQFTGLYHVSGDINGEGGTHCDGNGWFRLTGNPLATIPFWVSVLIAVVGALILWTARPTVAGSAPTAADRSEPAP